MYTPRSNCVRSRATPGTALRGSRTTACTMIPAAANRAILQFGVPRSVAPVLVPVRQHQHDHRKRPVVVVAVLRGLADAVEQSDAGARSDAQAADRVVEVAAVGRRADAAANLAPDGVEGDLVPRWQRAEEGRQAVSATRPAPPAPRCGRRCRRPARCSSGAACRDSAATTSRSTLFFWSEKSAAVRSGTGRPGLIQHLDEDVLDPPGRRRRRLGHRRRVAGIGVPPGDADDRARVQVRRVPGLAGRGSAAVVHLRDLLVRIPEVGPIGRRTSGNAMF